MYEATFFILGALTGMLLCKLFREFRRNGVL